MRRSRFARKNSRAITVSIAGAINEPMTRLEVECRTTMCGILYVVAPGGGPGRRILIADFFQSLGFVQVGSAGGREPDEVWRVVYVRTFAQ